jgi:Protein of unknown function (DUF2612)
MTQTADAYTGLIIPEHQGQPNLTATITLSVQPFVDDQNVLDTLVGLFDLDVAVGTQLDAVGVRVGRSRYLETPIPNVYFSWGVDGLGWGQGYWRGLYDPTQGVVALDDTTYRILLRATILANTWDGTAVGAENALSLLFNDTYTPGTRLFLYDNMNMSMVIGVVGTTPPAIFAGLLTQGEINLKPVGVGVSYVKSSVSGTPIFGFGVENDYISGWGVGSWAVPL